MEILKCPKTLREARIFVDDTFVLDQLHGWDKDRLVHNLWTITAPALPLESYKFHYKAFLSGFLGSLWWQIIYRLLMY